MTVLALLANAVTLAGQGAGTEVTHEIALGDDDDHQMALTALKRRTQPGNLY